MKRVLVRVIPLVALALVSLLVFGLRQRSMAVSVPETPATAAAAAEVKARVHAEGQVVSYPGARVRIAAEATGKLARVAVRELDTVKAGQLLAALDDSEPLAAWREALARVTESEVELAFQRREWARTEQLFKSQSVSDDVADRVRFARDAAVARRAVAAATAERLHAAWAKTRIVAPLGGVILSRFAEPGQFVVPGAELFTIADLERLRLEAEIDEYDVVRVKPGASVIVHIEGIDDQTWRATVEEVPGEVVSRRLRPQDPGKASDLRVLLAKIKLNEPAPLKLGQRVEVEIEAAP